MNSRSSRYLCFCFCICLPIFLISCKDKTKEINKNYTEIPSSQQAFVGSQSCISCHSQEYESWEGSHHDLAMKIADSTTVLGDFDGQVFTNKGIKTRFFKENGEYHVNTQGPDGEYHDYEVTYTFGVEPLQQYLIKFPGGQYQALLTAWDSEKNKWFDLQPELEIHHEEWMHWSGGSMRWNTMCADCHSTNLEKNFDTESLTYNTTFSEINVSCEACHGPASEHIAFYEDSLQKGNPPKLYMHSDMTSVELVDKCARCHSRRSQLTKVFDYNGTFLDHYDPELLTYPVYERDGQIRDEDYVYASFKQSKMYQDGVSCADCHDMHSTKLKSTGNDLCLNCHLPKYDSEEHHFHENGTDGSKCINCHMTGVTYMGNDYRRDHSFRIPRPDQTVDYGTPNACNTCHTDKSPEWAAAAVVENYGKLRKDHFSDHLLPGQLGDLTALEQLLENKKYPDIIRATALRYYADRQLQQREINLIQDLLHDSSTLVRNEAVRAFDNLGLEDMSTYIADLLDDEKRLVRISAARYFNTNNLQAPQDEAYVKAEKEFLENLEMNADFASGQTQIALYEQAKGNTELAIKAYRRAIEIDNYYNIARMNLALLLYNQGQSKEAEELYLKVAEQEPNFGQTYYMLGLLYNETGQPDKALEFLGKACDSKPVNLRACYNYALKLQEASRFEASLIIIEDALKTVPDNEEFLYIKFLGEIKSGAREDALQTARQLRKIAPGNSQYQQILQNLQGKSV